jgi:hypothetical protein
LPADTAAPACPVCGTRYVPRLRERLLGRLRHV